MDDETKSAISDMQSATSLHEGRQDSGDSSDMENPSGANPEQPTPSKFGLVIDDSKLEKTIQMILERVNVLEQQKTNEDAAALHQRSARTQSPPVSIDKLVMGISDRLNRIEAMVENADSDGDSVGLSEGGGAGRPTTSEGDKRMALTNQAFSVAQNEASKEHPSIPTITRTIFKELTAMSARVKRFEDSISQSMAFQDQKDKAQDELLAMEIQRIDEDIRRRVDHKALDKLGSRFKGEFDNVRRDFEEKLDRQAMKITNEVGRGVRTLRDQVKVINEANRDIMDQLDARIKHLEKSMANEMEELETRTRELIEESVYLAVSELRAQTEGKFAEAHDKLNTISTNVSSLTAKQDEMHVGSAGETTRLTNELNDVGAKLKEMFEDGGVMAMIEAGSKPAILELDRKLDAEIIGISASVKGAVEVAEAGRKALADKLKAETEEIRRVLEEEVKNDMGELNDGISRLASSTSDQLVQLHDDLDKQSTQLSHQCAVLNETVGRANAEIVETKSFLKIFDDRLTEYQVANGERLTESEQRITPLEEAAKAAQEAATVLAARASESEKYASGLREAITKCEEDIVAGQHSVVRVSDESRAHRRAIDGHMQALSEDISTRLTEDRGAIVSLEAKTAHGEALCQDLKDSFATLVTKESFWDVMEKRTKWHAERLAKHCNDTEAATSASDAPKLSPEAIKHMSGHSQRIAKIIASQADAAVLKDMVGGGVPAATELPTLAKLWDEMVDERRQFLLDEFIRRVEQVARRGRPKSLSDDHYSAEARTMFLSTTRLALRLALSKFARILPSETMLGVRGLAAANGSCAACARPFGRDPGPGDRRAGNPEEHSTVQRRKKHGANGNDEIDDETSYYGSGGSSIGGGSSMSTATSRNPFKQSAPKKVRSKSGREIPAQNTLMSSSIGSGGVKVGNLQLGSIGEWDDDGGSSVASGLTRQSELLGLGSRDGGPVTFPAV